MLKAHILLKYKIVVILHNIFLHVSIRTYKNNTFQRLVDLNCNWILQKTEHLNVRRVFCKVIIYKEIVIDQDKLRPRDVYMLYRIITSPRRGLRGIVFTRSVCVCVCVCLSVCLCVCVSCRYFGIFFLGY